MRNQQITTELVFKEEEKKQSKMLEVQDQASVGGNKLFWFS